MDGLYKKIANETKKTLDFLDRRAMEIFMKELELFHGKPVLIDIRTDLWLGSTGDISEKSVFIDVVTKASHGEQAQVFRSNTKFHLEKCLWVPRYLTLKPRTADLERFICHVDFITGHNNNEWPIDYKWRLEGPVKKES